MYMIPKVNGAIYPHSGLCVLPDPLTIDTGCDSVLAALLGERLGRLPHPMALTSREKGFIHLTRDESLAPEAYRLELSEAGITLTHSTREGAGLGLVTLFQILALEGPRPSCRLIEDKPRFSWRGFMLDESRHFFGYDEVKKLIEQCALLKINRFHWHLSDDQGFRIESKRFPHLNEIGSTRKETLGDGKPYTAFYTQQQIRELVDFAARRNILVIPEIDLPGHTTAITASYPSLSCSGEPTQVATGWGVFDRILCAGKEETYDFLDQLLEEVCGLFPAPYFHLGGDEAPKREWEKCPHCAEALKAHHLPDYEALQALFTKRLVDILERHGKRAIGWNETLVSGVLDPRVIIQYWMESEKLTCSMEDARKGRSFIFSNVQNFYLDYPHAVVPLKAILAYEPTIKGASLPPEADVLGVEAPLWAEHCPTIERMEKQVFPRLLALAEMAWAENRDYDDFMKRVERYLPLLDEAKVRYTDLEEATIHGEAGIQKIVEQFSSMFKAVATSSHYNPTGDEAGRQAALDMGRSFLNQVMSTVYTPQEIEHTLNLLLAAIQA